MKTKENILKYFIGLLVVVALRIVPHPPNVEPIMSTMMPFSKKWGWLSGLTFCLLAVLGFDLITGTLGVWSLVTAGTYALLGVAAGVYFKNKTDGVKYYVLFAVVATIVYDAITGIGMGVLLFHQTFMTTVTGQIPFTLYHLGGNIVFSILISPLLYKWVIANQRLETKHVLSRVKLAFK